MRAGNRHVTNKKIISGIHVMNKIKEVNFPLGWQEGEAALTGDEGLLRRGHWS